MLNSYTDTITMQNHPKNKLHKYKLYLKYIYYIRYNIYWFWG